MAFLLLHNYTDFIKKLIIIYNNREIEIFIERKFDLCAK